VAVRANRQQNLAITNLSRRITELPRTLKRLIALGVDASLCALSVYLAFYLRLGVWVDPRGAPFNPTMASIAIALPIFVSFGLYRAIFRYAGWSAILTVARAIALYAIPFCIIYTVVGLYGIPRTIGILQPILLFLLVGSSRLLARAYLGETYQMLWRANDVPRVLVYGAGSAGRALANALRSGPEMKLFGFIDDDSSLWKFTINGTPVFNPAELPSVVKRRGITDILLAIPSATRARRAEIVRELRALDLHVRTLPGVMDMARGAVSIKELRDIEIQDVLGRAPVPPDDALLSRNIEGKIVLVTGAGGSIGSELCRQIAAARPARLLLVDSSEYNLYAIHQDLLRPGAQLPLEKKAIVPLLGSVADEKRMSEVLATWQPETIFHAAAYKHVPLVEHNMLEGIRNNVFGTLRIATLAEQANCRNFVLISTDKAVRPTNIMGATKRVSELLLQALHDRGSATTFSAVRFGNVLGSSGSVVPLFRRQIAAGGPLTITHKEITRYFMTIPEAAQLVIQAGAMSRGGDIFLLDMGQPIKIIDLARNIIELSGLTVRDQDRPDGDIEIRVVGLRPGEKLYEELLIDDHAAESEHPRIMRSQESFSPWAPLCAQLDRLSQAIEAQDAIAAQIAIRAIVPEYQPNSPIVDWVTCARPPQTHREPRNAVKARETAVRVNLGAKG
jgi:FlaA1/EpsC-like NDP-sugar epimerase